MRVEGECLGRFAIAQEQTKPERLHGRWTDYALLIYVIEKVSNAGSSWRTTRHGDGSLRKNGFLFIYAVKAVCKYAI